jgi:hypothetical protein
MVAVLHGNTIPYGNVPPSLLLTKDVAAARDFITLP